MELGDKCQHEAGTKRKVSEKTQMTMRDLQRKIIVSKRYGQGNRSGTGTSDPVKGKEKDEGYNKEENSYISGPASHIQACYFRLTLLANFS